MVDFNFELCQSNAEGSVLYHWTSLLNRALTYIRKVIKIKLDLLFNSLFTNGPFKYYYGKLVFI